MGDVRRKARLGCAGGQRAGNAGSLAGRRLGAWSARAGLLGVLAGCGGPPPPPPTLAALTLSASADANADAAGQGAPVQIRIYQLSSGAGFANAEFFQLFNQDQATLGTDLVKRDEFILGPAQSKTASLTPNDQVKVIGVFAAYRNFQHATWRGVAELPPHQSTAIAVTAGQGGITVTSAPAAKPKPAT